MAEIFESYEEEFRGVAADAQRKLSEALTYESNPEKRRALLRQAEPQVQQLEALVCMYMRICVCVGVCVAIWDAAAVEEVVLWYEDTDTTALSISRVCLHPPPQPNQPQTGEADEG